MGRTQQGPLGKLRWVGRAWAEGRLGAAGRPDDEALSDAARFGIDLSEADLREANRDEDGVWAENADAALAFLAIATQWRAAMGDMGLIRTGLDYAGARAGLEMAGVMVTPDLWGRVQAIEAGALAAMAEARTRT